MDEIIFDKHGDLCHIKIKSSTSTYELISKFRSSRITRCKTEQSSCCHLEVQFTLNPVE